MRIAFEQVLHGYDDGHRALASSTTLAPAETALLDRLSDLSGFLVPGASIPPYLTLYPCGRFYAFARTWPDTRGKRSGTVLTHTLLLRASDVVACTSAEAVIASLRQPESVADREPYRSSLEIETAGSFQRASFSRDSVFAVVAGLLFTRHQRPVVVVDDNQHERLVLTLWDMLWMTARVRFSACTFSLGLRTTDRPFELLFVPSIARSSVGELARQPGWWDVARNASIRDQFVGVIDQPWFEEMLRDGVAWRDELLRWMAIRKIPMPPIGSVARLERMRSVDAFADTRITAARSRLDALSAITQLPGEHEYLQACVASLVDHQPTAPYEPTPLRSLIDLVIRPEVRRAASAKPALDLRVREVLQAEVSSRLRQAPQAALEEFEELYTATSRAQWKSAVLEGSAAAIFGDLGIRERLLASTADGMKVRVSVRAVAGAAASERLDLAKQVASHLPERWARVFSRILADLAIRMVDVALLVFAYERLNAREIGISRALTLIVSSNPSPESVGRLEALPPDVRARWCLSPVPDDWIEVAITRGPHWLQEAAMDHALIVTQCLTLKHGVRLLDRWIEGLDPGEAQALLSNRPELAVRLVVDALSEGPSMVGGRTLEQALQSCSDEQLNRPSVLAALSLDLYPDVGDRCIRRIAHTLVPAFVRNEVLNAEQFFEVPPWRRWARRVGPHGIVSMATGLNWRDALLGAWPALERTVAHSIDRAESIVEVVAACFREASGSTLDKVAFSACQWFQHATHTKAKLRLAAEAVVAIRRVEPYSSTQWLEACFYVAYGPTYRNEGDPFGETPWPRYQFDWDFAQPLREWLVRQWFDRRWPADAFLRTLSGDRQLLNDCLTLIRYRYGRWEFVEGLMAAAQRDATLREWVPTLEPWYNEFKPFIRRLLD